jgi:hypothetical protein
VATDDEKRADAVATAPTRLTIIHVWSPMVSWDIQVPKWVLRCAIPTTALPSLRAHLLLWR